MNGEMSAADNSEIARMILRYLEEHADAMDTIQGIAQWWLLREWSKRKMVEVEGAVSLLVSKNLIIETRRDGTQPYYRINQAKREEISKILNDESAAL